jgi:hypothetical protein
LTSFAHGPYDIHIGKNMMLADLYRKNSLISVLPFLLMTMMAVSCSTTGGRTPASSQTDGLETGYLKYGPWRITVPTTWNLTALAHGTADYLAVAGDGGTTGLAYLVEELPGNSHSGDVIRALTDAGKEAGAKTRRKTLQDGFIKAHAVTVSTEENVTIHVAVPRDNRVDLVSLSGTASVLSKDSPFTPEFLLSSCRADYSPSTGRIRSSLPGFRDDTEGWTWISDLPTGLLLTGTLGEIPVLLSIETTDQTPPEDSREHLIWTGTTLFAAVSLDTPATPDTGQVLLVDITTPPAENTSFLATVYPLDEPPPETLPAHPDFRRLVGQVLVLDQEKARL